MLDREFINEPDINHPTPSSDEGETNSQEHLHCDSCFDLNCTKTADCEIKVCGYCKVKLHACKVVDHEFICTKAFSPCINAEYGCPKILRNELRGHHLSKCSASALVCNLQWNREIIGKQAKRRMKQVAREFRKQMLDLELRENESDELDVYAAWDDQREILESYRTSRQSRVCQRTACTPANPVLPLRFYDQSVIYPLEDSSDEERFKEEQERKKKKQPFADCYICKLEPGMQHLHVLGNMNAKKDTSGKDSAAPDLDTTLSLVVPKFYQKRNLFVKLSEARMPDHHRKAFQYTWTREMHTFTCTAVMRRDEVAAHWRYHTDLLQLIDGGIIKRCPAALNGCDFYVLQLIPKNGGRIKYDETIRLFVYEPMPHVDPFPTDSAEPTPLGVISDPHILRLVLPYLDTTSVRTLSAVNSTYCSFVRGMIHSRTLASIKWVKDGKLKWRPQSIERSFSNIPTVATLVPNVRSSSSMAQHIRDCALCEKVEHNRNASLIKSMGDVFKAFLEAERHRLKFE